jgi:hypothetical protein
LPIVPKDADESVKKYKPERKMMSVIYLSLVTASISFTVTETKLFLPLREWIKKHSSFSGELLTCGCCFGHWVAFALVAIYRPRLFHCWWLLDYFLTALAIAWLAGFQWILMCWLMEKVGK